MTAPARGWDCHAHLFGPYSRYPLAADRSYTPPEALEGQYVALLERLGLSNGVLVHPSAYGDNLALLLDTLAARPNLRGVIVTRSGVLPALKGLRAQGVRAARFSHRSGGGANFAGSASFEDLKSIAPSLAEAGLHAELWTDCKALPAIAPELRKLPIPVVIDHMAMFEVLAGVDDPGFRIALDLLRDGHVYVKLCAYRNLLSVPDMQVGRPFHKAMLDANAERLLWGSDWPHLRVTPAPDAADLLAMFKLWTGDDAIIRRILVRNPARLYD